MKYLILSVVVLAVVYSAQAKTVQECGAAAGVCKQNLARMTRAGGNSREGFIRMIRTTPLDDICRVGNAFLTCNRQILDDPECNIHEAVSKYQPLYTRLSKAVEFICVREKDAIQRAIPCATSRQFFGKIAKCKKENPCNSDGSWNCAKIVVAQLCDRATSDWFESNIATFKANHPGCGEDNVFKKFHGALRNYN